MYSLPMAPSMAQPVDAQRGEFTGGWRVCSQGKLSLMAPACWHGRRRTAAAGGELALPHGSSSKQDAHWESRASINLPRQPCMCPFSLTNVQAEAHVHLIAGHARIQVGPAWQNEPQCEGMCEATASSSSSGSGR